MKTPLPANAAARLKKELFSMTPLPSEDWDAFLEKVDYKIIPKGKVLLKEGVVCTSAYFILKGSMRMYGIEHGKEINVDIVLENQIAADFKSYHDESPSQFFIVTMEETEVAKFIKKEYAPLLKKTESLVHMNWKLYESMFIKEGEHANMFKLFNPEERYQYIMKNQPELIQRVPVSQLASYLGMSRETLSRIRQRIS